MNTKEITCEKLVHPEMEYTSIFYVSIFIRNLFNLINIIMAIFMGSLNLI